MQTLTIELTPELKEYLNEIKEELRSLKALIQSVSSGDAWLPKQKFARKHGLSVSTLNRRIAAGKVEILDPEEKIKKCRWKGGVADE